MLVVLQQRHHRIIITCIVIIIDRRLVRAPHKMTAVCYPVNDTLSRRVLIN